MISPMYLRCTYALAFAVGGHFLREGTLTFAQLINTFLAITLSAEQARPTPHTPNKTTKPGPQHPERQRKPRQKENNATSNRQNHATQPASHGTTGKTTKQHTGVSTCS